MILEEGNWSYPLCHKCDMFISQKLLNVRNPSTVLCRWKGDPKRLRLVEEEAEAGGAMAIIAYSRPLMAV